MAQLPFPPGYNSTGSHEPRIKKARYGDGYEQRAADGLNNDIARWQLTWNLHRADVVTLVTFLKNLNAVTPFDWMPPSSSVSLKFIASSWTESYTGPVGTVTASIYQVYEP